MPPPGILNSTSLIGASTHLPDGKEDDLATRLALATFKKMHQRITLINYPEFDWPIGHVAGGIKSPNRVITLMKAFDQNLAEIEQAYKRAGILKKTLFVITADHGMATINRFVPQSIFADAIRAAGTTAPAISYNAGAYIWLADASKASAVASNVMQAHDPGIQSAYYLDTAGGRSRYVRAGGSFVSSDMEAANQYLLQTLMNGHQPNVVAFCTAHQSTSSPKTGWKADHGGASWQSQHIPLIFAGPSVRQGVVSEDPAQLEDIATTALTAMGVKPVGMEGRVLSEALIRSNPAARKARATEVGQITPLVNALIAQDSVESAG
jgi:arylsulfatase A-like enzyme